MLANAVDLDDGCAAVDQRLVEGDGIGERDGWIERKLHHGRGAAADEEDAERVAGRIAGDGLQHGERGGGSCERGLVRGRMSAGEELYGGGLRFGARGG